VRGRGRRGQRADFDQPNGWLGAWNRQAVDPGNAITYVSCSAAATCVAVDEAGNALTSSDPTGGTSAWNVGSVLTPNGSNYFTGDSCPSAHLCVITTYDGKALIATNPAGAAFWKTDQVVTKVSLQGVSCPTESFCATTSGPDVLTTTDPQAGPSSWHRQTYASEYNDLTGIACSSMSLCVAYGYGGAIQSAQPDPYPKTTGTPWPQALPGSGDPGFLTSASCASDGFCLLGDDGSNIWIGTAPPSDPDSGTPPTSPLPTTTSLSPTPTTTAAATTSTPVHTPVSDPAKPFTSGSSTAAHASPAVRIGRVQLSLRQRKVKVTVTCRGSAGSAPCRGRITLVLHRPQAHRARGVTPARAVLNSARYAASAGRSATIILRLSPRAARTLTLSSRWTTLQVLATSAAGTASRSMLIHTTSRPKADRPK
jgi:hypothetical protein